MSDLWGGDIRKYNQYYMLCQVRLSGVIIFLSFVFMHNFVPLQLMLFGKLRFPALR